MDLKIFTNNIEESALNQIHTLLEQEAFKNCKVRIMPDVHAGAGCVIGFTANLGDKVIPNVVGVDIGCGMTWVKTSLKENDVNLVEIDKYIREHIPSGMNVREKELSTDIDITKLKCYNELRNKDRYLQKSLGTLGGGNHFIEIDKDENSNLVFIIHSGSRNLGKQVAELYQNKAIKYCSFNNELKSEKLQLIQQLKINNESHRINEELKLLEEKYRGKTKLPKDLCYIEGEDRENYLHDMRICQRWASENRRLMMTSILNSLLKDFTCEWHETIHNYIGDDNIVRKGSISAYKNEVVLIPINMRDGCVIGKGKGNEDWNNSAPHGAGRVMSRASARKQLNMEEYIKTMNNIYSTSVCLDTIDEAPMAYKSLNEIIENMSGNVEVMEIIKPIYNFKAKE